MNIYLAAQFSEQALMLKWSLYLKDCGNSITSRWLYVSEEDETKLTDSVCNAALRDLEDIDKADVVISRTLKRGDLFTGGGRHIEFGYAYSKGKKLINVGGYESVFHHLPNVVTVNFIEEVTLHLK